MDFEPGGLRGVGGGYGRSTPELKETIMGEKSDEIKGRVKEAAGDLTDDRDLQRDGKRDQAGAKVKGKIDDAKDAANDAVDSVKDRLDR